MISNILLTVFLINVYLITNGGTNQVGISSSRQKFVNRRNISRNLFFTRSRVFNERACSCMTEVSCSCCETAFMLFHMMNRKVCANIMYQRNGLNIDLTIDGNILSSMTVTNYMPFKMCSLIPGSLSSKVCLNILELNIFSRSITVCPRLDFMTQNHRWILTYTCISISTLLPDMNMGMPMNSAIIVKPTTYRPQSSTSRSPSQQIQTAPGSNQMTSSLSVNSPSPVASKPQSTVGSSKPVSAETKSTSPIVTTLTSKTKPNIIRPATSTVTMMTTKSIPSKTKPTTAPMSTAKPSEASYCKITSENPPK